MPRKFKVHESVPTKPQKCVRCKKKINRLTGLQARHPDEGDISICVGCGAVMIFTAEKTLRRPTPEEWRKLSAEIKSEEPDVWRVIQETSRFFAIGKSAREN